MQITLEAVGTNGEMVNVGAYWSSIVPRVDEKITFWISRGTNVSPNCGLFRVRDVNYTVMNCIQTSEWVEPFPDAENTTITVLVTPESEEARRYIKLLTEAI